MRRLVTAIVIVLFVAVPCAAQEKTDEFARRWSEIEAGDHAAALDLARQVVAVNPRKLDYQLALGMALYRQGRFEEALAALEEALEIDTEPANEPLRLLPLALAQWQLGRREEALAQFDEHMRLLAQQDPSGPVATGD